MIALSEIVKRLRARSQPERIAIVALAGVVLSWLTYEVVFWFNPLEPRPTTSWLISFAIGVIRQHHLHRIISFHETPVEYDKSLGRDAIVALTLLIASTSLNYELTKILNVHHRIAWSICIMFVAALSYLLMKFWVFRDGRRKS